MVEKSDRTTVEISDGKITSTEIDCEGKADIKHVESNIYLFGKTENLVIVITNYCESRFKSRANHMQNV